MLVGKYRTFKSDVDKLKELSKDLPILFSPNMSIGRKPYIVKFVEMVSKAIGNDWDIEIVEASPTGLKKMHLAEQQ